MRRRLFGTAVLAAVCAAAAGALMVALTTEDLVSHSSLVVVGTVDGVTSYPPDGSGMIYSEATVRVSAAVVGATSEEVVTVRYMGGEYDGLVFGVTVEPTFRVGEEVVLFLLPTGDGVYRCPDGVQSKLSVVDGTVLPAGETLTAYLAKVTVAAGQ
ncbi:MAG TPA: hypothetical protein VMW93_02895 [bacterium]|nr:hypothetical protein [bacterium]